ncbi:tRNA (adenosine(37)-N6)-threonylcarbamoyltransferase complex ATPase subunit type 1 TsaE [Candidatus Omnitrophota bacterium]
MQILSESVNQTLNIGRKLSPILKAGDILCLFGGLGSGKTVLVKGIASGLGIKKSEVLSPTFILIRQYRFAALSLNHFDLYRLKSEKDILGLGYEDYFFGCGITVVEWADRLRNLMPKEYLGIELSVKGKKHRLIKMNPCGRRYKELINGLNENIRS